MTGERLSLILFWGGREDAHSPEETYFPAANLRRVMQRMPAAHPTTYPHGEASWDGSG